MRVNALDVLTIQRKKLEKVKSTVSLTFLNVRPFFLSALVNGPLIETHLKQRAKTGRLRVFCFCIILCFGSAYITCCVAKTDFGILGSSQRVQNVSLKTSFLRFCHRPSLPCRTRVS